MKRRFILFLFFMISLELSAKENGLTFSVTSDGAVKEEICDTVIRDTICVGESYVKHGFLLYSLSMGIFYDTSKVSGPGCDSLFCLELWVLPYPQLELLVSPNTLLCKGEEVKLEAKVTAKWNRYPIHIGDVLCTDGSVLCVDEFLKSTKTLKGVVYHVDHTGVHGFAISLKNTEQVTWCTLPNVLFGSTMTTEDVLFDMQGENHTRQMVAMGDEYFPVLQQIKYPQGWYLPAYGQMRLLYSHYGEVSKTLQQLKSHGFDVDLFTASNYWTSSQPTRFLAYSISGKGMKQEDDFFSKIKARAGIDF